MMRLPRDENNRKLFTLLELQRSREEAMFPGVGS